MILPIILFILIILIVSLLIIFLFYVFLPSINNNENEPFVFIQKKSEDLIKDEVIKSSEKKAFVYCFCNKNENKSIENFNIVHSCFVAKAQRTSASDCKFACLGLGDCVKVCPQSAIEVINGVAKVSNLCCGCGKCIDVCPQNIIKLIEPGINNKTVCNNENGLTSCINKNVEENIEWNSKKDFKIWSYCYKLYNKIKF